VHFRSKNIQLDSILLLAFFSILKSIVWFLQVFNKSDLLRLGSKYGGWSLRNLPSERRILLISAGVGEDVSFDIEFCSLSPSARVVLIDPTSRSKDHFEKVVQNLGQCAHLPYSDGGLQPIGSYDLSKISFGQVLFLNRALWNHSHGVSLEKPSNPKFVSYRKPTKESEDVTFFKSISWKDILADRTLGSYTGENSCLLLKLDIEGCEVDVLRNILDSKLMPCQILVEFDVLRQASIINLLNASKLIFRMLFSGYNPIHINGLNVSFERKNCDAV